jgi:hypothetical protein
MRSIIRKSVMLAGVFLVAAGASANAAASDVMEVRIPFPFVVNHHAFAPGPYMVERDASVVVIRGERDNHDAALALTMPAGGHDPKGTVPALTFKRYENQYRLSTIWESGITGEDVIGR